MASDLSTIDYKILSDNWMSPSRHHSLFNFLNYSPHSSHSLDGWQITFTPLRESVTNNPLPPSSDLGSLPVYQGNNGLTFASMKSKECCFSWNVPSTSKSTHDVTGINDSYKTNKHSKKGYKRRRSDDTEDEMRNYKKLNYFCSVCLKAFGYYTTFMSHLRTHSGERPFKCTSCHKAFTDRSTLIKHQRIHTGQRPYNCSLCGASFTQSGNLHRHRRRMHRL